MVAWLMVTVWLFLWEGIVRQVGRGGSGAWLRAPALSYGVEGLLLTLLAALWFASLGSGGWGLLFGVLGALMAWPGLLADRRQASWRGVATSAAAVLRIVGAGALLAWRLAAP